MKYLIKAEGRWYFKRRIPALIKEFDSRKIYKVALNTDSKELARQRAYAINTELEAYWQDLINNGEKHETKRFKQAMRVVQQAGFSYLPALAIAKQPLEEIEARVLAIENGTSKQVEAVLGFIPEQETNLEKKINLEEGLALYWDFAKDKIINKSKDEIRKWKNPRKKAVKNLVNLVGNKAYVDLTRNDLLKLRNWWIGRIENEDKMAQTANKDLIKFKTIVGSLNDNLQLGINIDALFKNITLDEEFEEVRSPFTTEFIQNVLLKDETLSGLHDQGKYIVYAMADTGARIVELVGLTKNDIILDHPIPHILIHPNSKKKLKTNYSKREIPLVGYALDAFKACPNGFGYFFRKPDHLSTTVNKYLRDKKVFPSEQHSLYSLRHSFQDRLTGKKVIDRIQAQLMGHKFQREKYGEGASLEDRYDEIRKIALK